jgi:hypothetical protein
LPLELFHHHLLVVVASLAPAMVFSSLTFLSFLPSASSSCLQSVPTQNDRSGQRRCLEFLGPAVVQLATMESAMVVHLSGPTRRSSPIPQLLVDKVFCDPSIVKVGCGIDMDLVELRSVSDIVEARSFQTEYAGAQDAGQQNTGHGPAKGLAGGH